MAKEVYQKAELLEELGLAPELLAKWEKLGLVRPPGMIDDVPFYTPENIDQINQIQQLVQLGYDVGDIQKIVRKVGLPNKDGKRRNKNTEEDLITVGELAKRANLNPRTIKYWEERGIISPDSRSTGGFRLYATNYVYLCELIQDLQRFGYSLEEIKETADLFRDFVAIRGGYAQMKPEEKLERFTVMEDRITQVRDKMNVLKQGIARWEGLLKKHRRGLNLLKKQATEELQKRSNDNNNK